MASKAFLLSTFLTAFLTARGCGLIPSGQGKTITFNLTNSILPAAMAFTQEMGATAIAPTISKTEDEAKAFVQRVVEQLLEDALYQQGRSALLSNDVISLILQQLNVRVTYKPLKCDAVLVEFVANGAAMMDNCHVVKDTITEICNPMVINQCDMLNTVKPVPVEHRSISGSITTTNIIMANWSKEMWQIILSRVFRSLKSGPLASSFYNASITVNWFL